MCRSQFPFKSMRERPSFETSPCDSARAPAPQTVGKSVAAPKDVTKRRRLVVFFISFDLRASVAKQRGVGNGDYLPHTLAHRTSF